MLLTGLPPSTKIFYRVSHGNALTAEASFTSRKAADADAVKFIMYADQALPVPFFAPAWRQVNQVVKDLDAGYDGFLLHPGDLGYAEGMLECLPTFSVYAIVSVPRCVPSIRTSYYFANGVQTDDGIRNSEGDASLFIYLKYLFQKILPK